MKRIFSLIVALVAVQVVSLAVDIDLTRTSYYVKVDGTGDGSSWETAMSSESFAYALPKVGDDVTFYVAEGTYFPIYDIDNNRVLDKFVVHRPSRNIRNAQPVPSYKATFVVNSDVSIKGGYPANSVTGSKNDPSKYKTIFSGDFLKNDEVLSTYYKSEYGNESDIVEITNVEDDCTALFTVKPSVKAIGETASSCVYDGTDTNNYFELEGVVLLNGNAVIKGVGLNLKTTIINSRIENGYISLLCKNHSLVVDDCVFYQSNCLNVEGEGKNIKITNSSFEEILGECTIKGQADDLKSTEVIFNSNKIFHANSFYFVIDNSYVKIHNCNINNNTNLVFDLSYDSVEIDNCNFTENTEKYYDNLIYLDNVADALFDSCVFYKNHCNIGMFQSLWGIMHKFENCLFESNTMGEGYDENNYLLIMESADFTKCTFLNNIVEGGDLIRNYGNNISNCTFVGNKVGNLLPTSYQNFYNNTVVGNFVSKYVFFQSYDAGVTDFYGNIVLGNNNQYDPICGYSNSCSSIIMDDMRYNLMMYVRDEGTYGEFYMPDNNTNIFVRPFSLGKEESTLCSVCSTAYKEYEESVLTSIFQGSYNSTTHVFTPVMDRSSYLPVVALKSDKLSDGTSLRFPLTETIVTEDQRNAARLKNTCMGAYEIPCEENVTTKKETIIVGTTFLGVTYTKSGVYEFAHKTTDENGCEATVNYTLTVKPDASLKEYFVKTESQGTGDGSSWDNAMSGADFAMVFPEVASGTKFYIAAGKYLPMYDSNGKVPTRNYDKEFFTKKCVSLYGGFPSSAKGTDLTNDPTKYKTILSGDFDGNSVYDKDDTKQEDAQYILRFFPVESGDIVVNGIEFQGTCQHYSAGSAAFNLDSEIKGVTCNVEKCTFTLAEIGLIANSSSLIVTDCYFHENNYLQNTLSGYADECVVTNCTFEGKKGNRTCSFGEGNVSMQNCTSVGNISVYTATGFNFVNNTLVGDLTMSRNQQCTLTGNILGGVVSITDSPVTSSYNIYLDVNSENEFISSTDLVRAEADMMPSDGKIVLANHGGFTPTIALESDKLSDGTSIRFPLSKTTVITDQRGVARLENTCMGAYEIECSNDTTLVRDTIYVGGKFMDVTYSQVGVHDSIFENLKAKNGCDSVVMHTLLVKPDPTVKEYYVKTKREGKGDGSSWENAMDGEDFAAVLPLAPDGATFYVAEGRYSPSYDFNGKKPIKASDLIYAINSNVKIIGGYTANAETGAISNPGKYKTVFTGDVNSDNTPDLTTLFNVPSNAALSLYGFYLKNTLISGSLYSDAGIVILGSFDCNRCTFDSCATAILINGHHATAIVDSSLFTNASSSAIYIVDSCTVNIKNSTFNDNIIVYPSSSKRHLGAAISTINSGTSINIQNCLFIGNGIERNTSPYTGGGALFLQGKAIISDCIFENNYSPYGGAIWVYDVDSCIITKSTFLGNKTNQGNGGAIYSITGSATQGYKEISNCTFINNEASGKNGGAIHTDYSEKIVNNTFINNPLCLNLTTNTSFIGNIIISNEENTGTNNAMVIKNNITALANNNGDVSLDETTFFLDGNYNETDEIFIPNLTYNGGFTPTVALKKDKLPDGTSIRFPLTETTVSTDQRGVVRLESTYGCV